MTHYIRLPLKNAYNVRDLGGYPCPGGVTRWNALLRADGLQALDNADIRFLLAYGVKTVIDLRSQEEAAAAPDPAALARQTEYRHIPLFSGGVSDLTKLAEAKPSGFISALYRSAFESERASIRSVIEAVAGAPEGGVLFHCAAGKDRTGIIAALLLGIAGVALPDILSNYEVTFTYIRQNPSLAEQMETQPAEFMYSKTDYLEGALTHIIGTYGSIPGYLRAIGVPEAALDLIRGRMGAAPGM